MTIRKPLRDDLVSAWSAISKNAYSRQRINSERSLQAALWSELDRRIPSHFRMFIEPRFCVEDESTVIPDIVICNSRSIVAVIEIKYQPRVQPRYSKDVRTLDALSRNHARLSLRNERFSGRTTAGQEYKFASKTLFVWAGIHRPSNGGSFSGRPSIAVDFPALRGRFMQLHTETNPKGDPIVYHRTY